MTTIPRQGPLKGMRVIELAHVMAGPVCGLMLADMGADVIKVEKSGGGDDTRRMLPPAINGEAAAYMMMNRNKRGIVLDLKHPKGKDALLRLVKNADVLTENYRHDTLSSLGLGYEDLRKVNPGLIYAAISGFGRSGPLMEQGGFDLIAQGMSGLMSITGEAPGRQPVKVGAPVCDITAGLLLAMGVIAAYTHKLKTGQGQMVDTSLFEAGITHTYWQSAIAFATGVSPQPMGSAHPLNAPYQAFETKDGWINIGAANQKTLGAVRRSARSAGPETRFPLCLWARSHEQSRRLHRGTDAASAQTHHGRVALPAGNRWHPRWPCPFHPRHACPSADARPQYGAGGRAPSGRPPANHWLAHQTFRDTRQSPARRTDLWPAHPRGPGRNRIRGG